MILINFSHPLTDEQLTSVEALTDQIVERVIHVPAQFEEGQSFAEQATALVEACGLTASEWQTEPLLIMPPALSFIAALTLAELHGRMGYFPPLVRTRPVAGSTPRRYEVAEVLDLQAQRDAARQRR
jgi:hypothetical protein